MRSTRFTLIGGLCMAGVSSLALGACMDDGGTVDGTGGGGPSSGGSTMGGTGGSMQGGSSGSGTMGGTGGSAQGGSSGSGTMGGTGGSAQGGSSGSSAGTMAKGGSSGSGMAGSGMMAGTGGSGAGAGGSSGSASGGMGNTAGMSGRSNGGAAGTGMGGMTGGAGTSSGDCVKGMTKGKDVAVIGESFIAATHQITQEIEAQAKAAGALPQSDKYVDNSVSGTTLANNQIPSQYDKAVSSSGTIKYVLMDGGGNDCLINNNGDAALTAAMTLFTNMASHNTEKILYFFYPDPIGNNFASLKSCLDSLRPKMKALCDGLTAPKCYWLDLRDTWAGHNEYTSDGIHPTAEGAKATGDVIWKSMVTNCVAQ